MLLEGNRPRILLDASQNSCRNGGLASSHYWGLPMSRNPWIIVERDGFNDAVGAQVLTPGNTCAGVTHIASASLRKGTNENSKCGSQCRHSFLCVSNCDSRDCRRRRKV